MEIIIILLLIILNGLFSMSEFALISSRKTRIEAKAKQGSKKAKRAISLIENPNKFLSTIQVGITFIGILTGLYSGDTLAKTIEQWLPEDLPAAGFIAKTSVVLIITYFTIVFGELMPKKIALVYSERILPLMAGIMTLFSKICFPFVWILTKSVELISRIFGLKETNDTKITEEEILAAIEQGTSEGEIKEVEQDIVERVFDLGDRDVESLMTYRNELVCIDINDSIETIKDIAYHKTHSYYPVVDGHLDKLLGVIYLKDLIRYCTEEKFEIQKYINKPQYLSETTDAYRVLSLFRETKMYYAFIVDEFGSLQGMVTAMDMMEALVGKIVEPQENEETIIQNEDNDTWTVDGQYSFYDFLSHFDMEDIYPENDYNTLSGLILDITEYIPKVGEKIQWHKFEFEIKEMDGARIDKVLVRLFPEKEEDK